MTSKPDHLYSHPPGPGLRQCLDQSELAAIFPGCDWLGE